jgi:uncharacterized protein (DUF1778 family)
MADMKDDIANIKNEMASMNLEKTEKVIESESTIVLTRRESLRLLEMIENPPPRNEKFLRSQARYQRLKNDAGFTDLMTGIV